MSYDSDNSFTHLASLHTLSPADGPKHGVLLDIASLKIMGDAALPRVYKAIRILNGSLGCRHRRPAPEN